MGKRRRMGTATPRVCSTWSGHQQGAPRGEGEWMKRVRMRVGRVRGRSALGLTFPLTQRPHRPDGRTARASIPRRNNFHFQNYTAV